MQQQMYPCPRCGAPVEYGSRFCSNCGLTMQQAAPPPPPYGTPYYPPPQQPWGQQRPPYNQPGGWNQPPPYQQAPGWGGPPPYQQQNMYGYRGNLPPKKGSSSLIGIMVILIIIVFSVGGLALATDGKFFSSSKPVSSTPKPTTTPSETPPPSTPPPAEPTPPPAPTLPATTATPITAKELITAFSEDMVSASAEHQGKTYAISGTVSGVNSSVPPYLYLSGGTPERVEIQCAFSQGQEANISMLDVGKTVKVEGTLSKFQSNIIVVSNCKLVQ